MNENENINAFSAFYVHLTSLPPPLLSLIPFFSCVHLGRDFEAIPSPIPEQVVGPIPEQAGYLRR